MLNDAAVALDAIAENKHTARREAEHALVRVDTAVAAMTGPEAAAAQRFSKQLQQAAEFRFPDLLAPDVINPLRAAADARCAEHLTWTSPILRHAVRLSAAVALAVAADRFAPIAHGHWIALTVLYRAATGDGAHLHPLRRAGGGPRRRDRRRVVGHDDLAADGCARGRDGRAVSGSDFLGRSGSAISRPARRWPRRRCSCWKSTPPPAERRWKTACSRS